MKVNIKNRFCLLSILENFQMQTNLLNQILCYRYKVDL